MKPAPLPLEIIRDWWTAQQDPARGNLAFFVLVRCKPFDPIASMGDGFPEWLSERLDYFQHLGRTMMVRALIDYTVDEQASEQHLANVEDLHMTMVDDGKYPKDMRKIIGDHLPTLPDSRKAWEDAGKSWRVLRDTFLTDAKLRAWEKDMQLRGLGR